MFRTRMNSSWLRWVVAAISVVLSASAEDDLHKLIESAMAVYPDLSAARERVLQAEAEHEGLSGFFDPRAVAGVGYTDRARDLFGLTWRAGGTALDGSSLQAGVETAFLPGFYAGIGAAQHQGIHGETDDNEASLVGARIRIPLLQNRGFGPWRLQHSRTEAGWESTRAHLLAVAQKLESEVETRYIDLQLAFAQTKVAHAATARAEQLVQESEDLVRLQAVASYQTHQARLEVARRREEEESEVRSVDTAWLKLEELSGIGPQSEIHLKELDLSDWAGTMTLPEIEPPGHALSRRGDVLERLWDCIAQKTRLEEALEGLRHDLSLEGGGVWEEGAQADRESHPSSSSDAPFGGDVALIWRHPLGDRTAKASVKVQKARLQELLDLTRSLEQTVSIDLNIARKEYDSAAQRMIWIAKAAQSARAALAAEEDRFRLGDGTSRQVLDAQKDLTDVLKRQNTIITEALHARARYRYAAGLLGEPFKKEAKERHEN